MAQPATLTQQQQPPPPPFSTRPSRHSHHHHHKNKKKPPRPRSRPRLFLPPTSPPPILPQQQVAESVHEVRAHWNPQSMTLEEVLQHYPLPQLVRCHTQGLRGLKDGGPIALSLDSCPILLGEVRTVRHLLARIVRHDPGTNGFNESTDSVVIPEDYEGHFLRLESRTTKDKTKVKSLQTIAHDDTPAFLNLANITSFPAQSHDLNHQPKFIYTVGNVFLVDEPLPPQAAETRSEPGRAEQVYSTVSDNFRQTSAVNGIAGRSSNGLMKCLDERGQAIMVPTNQVGEMVTVKGEEGGGSKLSVQCCDMMTNQQFPLLARYAYGKRHPRLTAFSKLLTLLDSFQETSVIACVIKSASVMLMEIPVTSSLNFQVAMNSHELLKVPRMRRALEVCGTQGREFSRDIKFKYKFSHSVQESTRRMMRMKEGDMPSATVRTRLVVTETYLYI